jgi:hypothetical protein
MNKLLYFLCIILILCFEGCLEKDVDTTVEYTKSLVNETDKILFYTVRTTAGSDSTFSYGRATVLDFILCVTAKFLYPLSVRIT